MYEKPFEEMVSVLMSQVDSLTKRVELVTPTAFLELARLEGKTAEVREKYASTFSKVIGRLRKVLEELQQAKSRDPDLEAKLTQAIERVEELKRPYVTT